MQIELFLTKNHRHLDIGTGQSISVVAQRLRWEENDCAHHLFPILPEKTSRKSTFSGQLAFNAVARKINASCHRQSIHTTGKIPRSMVRIPMVWYGLNNMTPENQEAPDPCKCTALGTSVSVWDVVTTRPFSEPTLRPVYLPGSVNFSRLPEC